MKRLHSQLGSNIFYRDEILPHRLSRTEERESRMKVDLDRDFTFQTMIRDKAFRCNQHVKGWPIRKKMDELRRFDAYRNNRLY